VTLRLAELRDQFAHRRAEDDAKAERLLGEMLAGDENALGMLYDQYCRLVYSIALGILKDPGEAEDMVQDVFLTVYRSANTKISGKGTVRGWIVSISYHSSLNRWYHLRSRRFFKQESLDTIAGRKLSIFPDHIALLELKELLGSAISVLSPAQQETLRMYFYEGYLLREIADRMKEPYPNIRNHFYRGLAKMRTAIRNQGAIAPTRTEDGSF
jgi:RNA polymerase sigma-70 factor (ECF subfamily)